MNGRKTYKQSGFDYQKKFVPNIKKGGTVKKVETTKKKINLYGGNWEELRKLVYKRDGNRCVYCGKKGKLHAHHLAPVRISKDNSLNNLVSVCEKCHRTLEAVGFAILEGGGSTIDVKRTELKMIAEAKKKRLEKYQAHMQERKEAEEKQNGEQESRRNDTEYRPTTEIVAQSICDDNQGAQGFAREC